MKHEKSCGAVVYKRKNGGYLFLIEHMALGHVSIPKGHIERGETEEETALREIKEETNLDVALDTGFRNVITFSPRPGCLKDVVFFVAEAKPGRLKNQESEVSALEWLPFDEAARAITHDSDRETLAKAREYLIDRDNGKGEVI